MRWDGEAWTYAWGSVQNLDWARAGEADRAQAYANRAALMQRLLRRNDKVLALGADASVAIYRRIPALDCITVDCATLGVAAGGPRRRYRQKIAEH